MADVAENPQVEEVSETREEAAAGGSDAPSGGNLGQQLSQADIEAAAREAGVDPQVLAQQAAAFRAQQQQQSSSSSVAAAAAQHAGGGAAGDDAMASARQSRAEKKSRKALSKLGLKPIGAVSRAVFKKDGAVFFVVSRPDVYKSSVSETYVMFGEAKVEDLGRLGAQAEAQQFLNSAATEGEGEDVSRAFEQLGASAAAAGGGDKAAAAAAEAAASGEQAAGAGDEDEEEDEEDVDAKDIDLVVQQAGVERRKAVRALKNNKGDIVNAILELTV